MFSLLVGLGVNCRSPRGSEEHQIAVDSTNITKIPKEATQEKEKETLKLQPENLKKKEKGK